MSLLTVQPSGVLSMIGYQRSYCGFRLGSYLEQLWPFSLALGHSSLG